MERNCEQGGKWRVAIAESEQTIVKFRGFVIDVV